MIHSAEDLKVSARMLNRLKAIYEKMLRPKEIRRISKKLHLTLEAASDQRRSPGFPKLRKRGTAPSWPSAMS
jgi:hypothetical protein